MRECAKAVEEFGQKQQTDILSLDESLKTPAGLFTTLAAGPLESEVAETCCSMLSVATMYGQEDMICEVLQFILHKMDPTREQKHHLQELLSLSLASCLFLSKEDNNYGLKVSL